MIISNKGPFNSLQISGFQLEDGETRYPAKDAGDIGKKIYLLENDPGIRVYSDYGGLIGYEIDLRNLDSKIKILRVWAQ